LKPVILARLFAAIGGSLSIVPKMFERQKYAAKACLCLVYLGSSLVRRINQIGTVTARRTSAERAKVGMGQVHARELLGRLAH
jgi:hypothetical protein